jgi:nitrite reductase (NO-forming)
MVDASGNGVAQVGQEEGRGESIAFSWAAFFVAAISLIVAIAAMGLTFANAGDDNSSEQVNFSGAPLEVDVVLSDMRIEPAELEVQRGQPLELTVTNEGAVAHDFWLPDGQHTPTLAPGETVRLDADGLESGGTGYCSLPGHRDAGMHMKVRIAGATPDTTVTTVPPTSTLDFSATADEAFEAYDPSVPVAADAAEHRVTLHMTEQNIEVAPGVTQQLWTFGGTVPGTPLRGKVGDRFVVTIVNDGSIDHSIDFHASKVAWNDEMRSIKPGESLEYAFTAKHAGVFMYHCGTPPALHHIGNGMFGALIIDPPDLSPVDHEYLLVQSELYLGAEGEVGDLAKMQRDQWDAVVFNSYVNQYRDRPIRVEPDERVRVWVLDAGPSENSAFHVVGTIFDTVWKEGSYLLQPDATLGGSQVLDLQPAQGGFVEFTFDEAGLYPIVTHKFSNVARGALGLFQAGEVDATGGGH